MKWLNLGIVFALIFGGGLAIALGNVWLCVALMSAGAATGLYFDRRNLLPE